LGKYSFQAGLRLLERQATHIYAIDGRMGEKGSAGMSQNTAGSEEHHNGGCNYTYDNLPDFAVLFGFLVQPLPRLGLHLGFTDRFHKKPSCFDRYVK